MGLGCGEGDVSIRTLLKHRLGSDLSHSPGVSIVWAVGFKVSLRGVCLFVNINALKFHSGFFVHVLGCQGVEFNCHPLGVSLRFGAGHFTDISVPLFLTAPRGVWDLSPPARD